MALKAVSQALWTERELLEQLLFKLEEERALVHQGGVKWLGRCIEEIVGVMGRIDEAERDRVELWHDVTSELDLGDDASLKDVIGKLAFPWDSIFTEHQRALTQAARECESTAHEDDDRLGPTGACDLRERLGWLSPMRAA